MNIFETLNEGEEETTATEIVDEDTSEEESESEGEEIAEEEDTEEKQTTTPKETTDYKAKYEALQKKIAGDAFKKREAKHKDPAEDNDGEDDDSKPLTKAELARLLDEREGKILRVNQESKAMDVAKTLTESEDEALYAVELFKHITLPFDTLEENMRFIVAGMNADRLIGQTEEVKRALKSKETARKNTAITVRDKATASQPAISGDIKAVLKKQGYKYLSDKKVFGKKLATGKMLFNDGKGRTWMG